LILASAVGLAACGGTDEASQAELPAVATARAVFPTVMPAPLTYSARVEAGESTRIATRMAGTLESVRVEVGDRVRSGEVLAALDDRDVNARIEAAGAQERLAERAFRRIDALTADGAASAQEHDRAEAALATARAALAEARAQSAYVELRAPYDGVVTERLVDAGSLVSPGQVLLTISSLRTPKVVADLPAEAWVAVAPGSQAEFDDPRGSWSGLGRVARRSPRLAEGSRRFRIELDLEEPASDLLPGTVLRLRLEGEGAESLWIPAEAVVERGQLKGVFVHVDGTLRLRWIRTGLEARGLVEILAGLDEWSEVVLEPGSGITDGTTVGQVTMSPTRETETDQ
jgi:RND family efflux transporter MFP subunit